MYKYLFKFIEVSKQQRDHVQLLKNVLGSDEITHQNIVLGI